MALARLPQSIRRIGHDQIKFRCRGKASEMRYLFGVFVLCTLALVWAVIGIVRHIRRHNAEVAAHETATHPPTE